MMDNREEFLMAIAAAFVMVALSAAAFGQEKALPASANPTFANPDTPGLMAGKPAPDVANTVDIVFLKQFSLGGRAEVELGRIAGSRGEADAVDQFGKHMVKDHTDANSRLAALARAARVELPTELDAEHVAAKAELENLSGKTFDIRYAESQIKDHQKAAQLLIHEIGSGQHVGVRQFAADTLPRVMEHLDMAKTLHAQLTGAGPPPVPKPPKQ
jgi:putative membrane protein